MSRFVAGSSLFAVLALFAFAPSQAAAQTADPTGGAGIKAYGAYHGSSIEHISLETSKLIVNIPLISYPQRGGKLRVDFELHWHNPVYTYQYVCNPYLHPCLKLFEPDQAPPYLFQALEGQPYVTGVEWQNEQGVYNNTIWDSDGGGHQATPIYDATGPIYRSIDATGYWFNQGSSNTVIMDANGIQYTYPASGPVIAEDPNGNEMTIGTSVVDTLGRTIPYPLSSSNPTTTDYTGCTGPLPTQSASLWTIPDQTGGTVTFKFCYASVHVQINFFPTNCSTATLQCDEPDGNFTELQSIVLPNGTAWEFEYNGGTNPSDSTVNAGLLSKITLPTGGTISYTWTTPPEYVNTGTSSQTYSLGITSRTADAQDGTGPKTWTYAPSCNAPGCPSSFTHSITDPLGNNEVHTMTVPCSGGTSGWYDTQVQYYQGAVSPANLLKTVSTTYSGTLNPYAPPPPQPASCVNVVPLSTTTTWPNGRVSQETKTYDSGFSVGSTSYYYGKVVSDAFDDYGTNAPGAVLKQVNNTWLALTNGNYLTGNLLNLLSSQQIVNASGVQQSYTSNTYDGQSLLSSGVTTQFTTAPNGTYRGNLTGVSHWLNTTNSNLTTTNTYYDAGMLGKTQDPLGNVTQYFYSTTYAGGYLTSLQDALNHTTTFTYDYNTGEMLTKVDANKQTTSYSYDDMRRVVQVKYPDGGQTNYQYTETAVPFTVTTTDAITSSLNKTTVESVDGFGRETESQLTSDPQGTVYVYTAYDGDGREYTVTNPYRTSSDSTYGTTAHLYDGLGRITTVTQPDGSQLLTSYTGNCTTVTDETGKKRTSCVDGLGRLTGVWEDPSGLNYETDYVYDPLGDLLSVNQKGGSTSSANWRPRTFTYDSLSRIVCAANPEVQAVTCPSSSTGSFPTGAILYAYDSDSNLLTKTAPAPNQTGSATVTTTYGYDGLNRVTKESYSDGTTPTVEHGYDGTLLSGCATTPPSLTDTYPIGRSTSMCDGSGATSWSHDQIGRELSEERTIEAVSGKFINYTYNLDGSLATLTTPPLKTITYTPGGAGRPLKAVDTGDSINFVTGATYAPTGALTGMVNGSTATFAGITTTNGYNNRLQPVLVSAVSPSATVFSLCHDFHLGVAVSIAPCSLSASTLGDNGNVYKIVNNKNNSRTRNYTYDSLNRIATAATQGTSGSYCWGQTFTIDAWSNLNEITPSQCSAPPWSNSAGPNNQVIGFCYGAAGNLLDQQACPSSGINTYVYDAENRLIWTAGYRYIYDGDGERVEKCEAATSTTACPTSGTNGTLYWTGVGSETLDETDLSGKALEEYTYFAGQRVARRDISTNDVHYYFSDHLGSASVITDSSGNIQQESDYYPYGGELVITSGDPNRRKFTGKERDTESGLDSFGARYYASTMGRFMTPDWAVKPVNVPYAKFGDPQTLNLYSYVENGPLNRIDADGHAQQQSGDSEAGCFNHSASCSTSPNNQPTPTQERQQVTQQSINRLTNDLDTLTKPVQPLAKELQKLPDVNPTVSGTGMGLTTTATFKDKGTEVSVSVTPQIVAVSGGLSATLDKSSSHEIGTLDKELGGGVSVSTTYVTSEANPNKHVGAIGVSFGAGYPPIPGGVTPSTPLDNFKSFIMRSSDAFNAAAEANPGYPY